MKSSLLCLGTVILSGCLPLPLLADSFPAKHHISAVTVFPDRALVTRSGSLKLPPGEHQVVFEGLPMGLDENSIRASSKSKGFQIRGVELRQDYKKPEESEASRKLQAQIKALEERKQDLQDEQNDLTEKKSMLEKLSGKLTQGGDDKTKSTSVQDIKTFVDYYGAQISQVSSRLRAIERSTAELNRQLADANRDLEKLSAPASADQRTVLVTVDSTGTDDAELDINYLISGASWSPQYDANAQDDGGKIQLTSYGIVRQTTGEKWDDVRITLSTARPQQGTSVPELKPWTVNFPLPVPAPSTMANADYANTASRNGSLAFNRDNAWNMNSISRQNGGQEVESELVSSQLLVSNVETRGFSAVYKVPGVVSVPSDNQAHRCTISIQDMSAKLSYVSTPKLASGAYVKAEVKNASEAPLLPGQLNVFMQNDFIGQSQLNLVGPEGVFSLYLGKDDGIKVTRKDKVRKNETSGILSKAQIVRLGFKIEVENFKKTEQSISIKDQLPLSQNEQIKVRLADCSIKPDKENKDNGELIWNLKIPSRQKKTIEVEYEIESPLGTMVGGI